MIHRVVEFLFRGHSTHARCSEAVMLDFSSDEA